MKRVIASGEVAFLNDGSCDMSLFKELKNRNMKAFETVAQRTQGYYNAKRGGPHQSCGAAILSLVRQALG